MTEPAWYQPYFEMRAALRDTVLQPPRPGASHRHTMLSDVDAVCQLLDRLGPREITAKAARAIATRVCHLERGGSFLYKTAYIVRKSINQSSSSSPPPVRLLNAYPGDVVALAGKDGCFNETRYEVTPDYRLLPVGGTVTIPPPRCDEVTQPQPKLWKVVKRTTSHRLTDEITFDEEVVATCDKRAHAKRLCALLTETGAHELGRVTYYVC